MPLVLTIDVEDWAQSTLDTDLPITSRAQRNMEHLLDLLEERERTTTCFVLGKFAEKFPETVRRIAANGHEVASHGYGHVDVFRLTPEQFREDVRRSKAQLEEITGQEVVGYRAPDFSIIKQSLWALDILSGAGFTYDASINPAVAARFGIPDWPAQPVTLNLPSGMRLVELPVATMPLLGRAWPVAGGGYHRLLPWIIIRYLIAHSLARKHPFVAYCHPYEFDPHEFRILATPLPLKTRLHQGLGRRGFEAKFCNIIREFASVLAKELARQEAWPTYNPQDV